MRLPLGPQSPHGDPLRLIAAPHHKKGQSLPLVITQGQLSCQVEAASQQPRQVEAPSQQQLPKPTLQQLQMEAPSQQQLPKPLLQQLQVEASSQQQLQISPTLQQLQMEAPSQQQLQVEAGSHQQLPVEAPIEDQVDGQSHQMGALGTLEPVNLRCRGSRR